MISDIDDGKFFAFLYTVVVFIFGVLVGSLLMLLDQQKTLYRFCLIESIPIERCVIPQ
jgi:hypothetical protein